MAAVAQGGPGFPSPGPFQLATHRSWLYERARIGHLVCSPVSGQLDDGIIAGQVEVPVSECECIKSIGDGNDICGDYGICSNSCRSKPDSSSTHYGQRSLSGPCRIVREEAHALKDACEMKS